jgi:hypothetical protein
MNLCIHREAWADGVCPECQAHKDRAASRRWQEFHLCSFLLRNDKEFYAPEHFITICGYKCRREHEDEIDHRLITPVWTPKGLKKKRKKRSSRR